MCLHICFYIHVCMCVCVVIHAYVSAVCTCVLCVCVYMCGTCGNWIRCAQIVGQVCISH